MKTILRTIFSIAISILLFGGVAYAATTVSLGKNGTSEYLLYPADSFSASSINATSSATSTFAGPVTLATTTINILNGTIMVNANGPYAYNSTGIQSALNTCSTSGCGEVQLSCGTYAITTTVTVPSNTILQGDGYCTDLVLSTGAGISIVNSSNISLVNFRTDATAQSQPNDDHAVYLQNAQNIFIQNDYLLDNQNFGVFMKSTGTATTSNIWVSHNDITGFGGNDLVGGGPENSTGSSTFQDIFVENNDINQNDVVGGVGYDTAVDIVGVTRVSYINNKTVGAMQFGSEQYPNDFSLISNNIIYSATTTPNRALIDVIENASDPGSSATQDSVSVIGNVLNGGYIYLAGASGASRANRFSITGNVVVSNPQSTNGIWVQYYKLGTVSNNTIRYGNIGILIDNSDHVNVTNNNLTDNGTFGIKELTGDHNLYAGNIELSTSVPNAINYSSLSPTSVVASDNIGNFFSENGYPTFNQVFGLLGVASSSPGATLSVAEVNGVATPLALFSTSTSAYSTTTSDEIDSNGNLFLFNGAALSLTSTTTSTNGFNITKGCYAINGVCLTSGSSITGTQGQNLIIGSTGSPIATSSLFTLTNGYIGIGTTTPIAPLDILSGSSNTAIPDINVGNSASNYGLSVSQGRAMFGYDSILGNVSIGGGSGKGIAFYVNGTTGTFLSGTQAETILSNGNVGIGTSSPYANLSVAGTEVVTGSVTWPSITGTQCIETVNGLVTGTGSACSTGSVNSGTTGQVPYYAANGTTLTATSSLFIGINGYVGLSSTTPVAPLSVSGSGQLALFGDAGSGANAYLGVSGSAATGSLGRAVFGFSNDALGGDSGNTVIQGAGGKGIEFNVNAGSFAAGTAAIINMSGMMGIGTTTPTNPLTLPAGSAAVPSISFGDTGTGIYRSAKNAMEFTQSGSNLANLSSSGLTIGNINASTILSQAGGNSVTYTIQPTAVISHNLGDSYAALVVAQKNAGATGNILELTNNSATTTVFTQAGFEGIGTSTPWQSLSVAGGVAFSGLASAASGNDTVCINPITFQLYIGGGATTCNLSSETAKNTIATSTVGIEELMKLRPVTFYFDDKGDPEQQLGLISQEADAVDPRLVTQDASTTIRTIKWDNVDALLIKSVQELFIHQTTQDQEIATLQQEVSQLKQRQQVDAMCEFNP